MFLFQFSPMTKPRLTARLLKRTLGYNVRLILDLEDGLQNLLRQEESSTIKAQGREDAQAFYRDHADLIRAMRVGFRINAISTNEFLEDAATLKQISQIEPLDCIILTKVSSAEELHDSINALAGVRYADITPIIETVEGLANLASILDCARALNVRSVVYGHYDYSIDASVWPFLDHDQVEFWSWVEPIIDQIEAYGLCYVHPPYPHTSNDDGFRALFNQLRRRCSNNFGMIGVGLRQTECWSEYIAMPPSDAGALRLTGELDESSRLKLATDICDCYEAHMRQGLSFVLEPQSGRFIPPHEYLAARQFLQRRLAS